uniref:Venom S1 protease with CUB domain 8 n=1 Tax=Ectomocoris sp. TaxID=3104572 RepID=A0AB38ZEE5_9HEMI
MQSLQLVIITSTLAVLAGGVSQHREIDLPKIGEEVIQNPGYPDTYPDPLLSMNWTLNSPPGTTISIDCPDIRISPSTNCEKGFLKVTHSGGGTPTLCGTASGLLITSKDNQMKLQFELKWASGVFQCMAKFGEAASGPVKAVTNGTQPNSGGRTVLKPGQALYNAINVKPIPSSATLFWEFIAPEGYKIVLKCPILWMTKRDTTPGCLNDYVEIDSGDNKQYYCTKKSDLTTVSVGTRLAVKIVTTEETFGLIQCSVITTTGKHFKEFLNEPDLPVEDSSEHGVVHVKGPKGTTCDCGWVNKPSPSRILHGTDVAPHEFPWMAGLMSDPRALYTFCGGTIITKHHVISAAHCTFKYTPSHVVVGMINLAKSEGGQIVPVEKIVNHGYIPNSHPSTKDITILILSGEIKFGPHVGPACLPKFDPGLANKPVTAIGWGNMAKDEYASGRDSGQLKKAKLRVISMDSCNPVWDGKWPTNPQIHICTWHKNKDVCYGDSGGPVVWLDPETNRYTLIGIPSVCDGCKLTKPSIHTAVHYYHPWILGIIKGNNHAEEQVCTKID